MTIETHTSDRKALARQIGELLQEQTVYTGAPSFAYAIGPVTVDRLGAIHTDDSKAMETLKPFLIEEGYIEPETEPGQTEQEPTAANTVASDIDLMEIAVPADMTVSALKNLIYTLYTKQYLLNRAIGQEVYRISDGVVAHLSEYTPESPEAFVKLQDDFRALGDLDGVDFRNGQVTLFYPFNAVQPGEWAAYATLTAAIVKAAMSATRVKPNRMEPENEKYFMHSWLLRLGLSGPEHKKLRSLLLRNLHGHSAFSSDEEAQKHKEKYAQLRQFFAEREGRT